MSPERRLPALDGIRAIAVAGVLAAHTGLPGLPGGFVGVDVFFVLSGFLITSLLLDERRTGGRVDLAAFWARRARRLLPAALVMIAFVVAFRRSFAPDAVTGLRADALSAGLWSSNWRFALAGTDYFARGGTPSPLQHTWSLAVEEQFYLVWPVILVLVWQGAHGRLRRQRAIAVAVLGTLASAGVTFWLAGRGVPGRVYFGTDTRAQELLVGAALAGVMAPTWRFRNAGRRAQRSPQALGRWPLPGLLGAAGLAALVFLAREADGSTTQFRSGLMLAVSLAAAALIAGILLDGRSLVARILAAAPLVAIGRISYGIYLWHWPVFELLSGTRTGLSPGHLAVVRIATAVAAAGVSWWLVEIPARRLSIAPRRLLPAAAVGVAAVVALTVLVLPSARPGTSVDAAQALPAGRVTTDAQGRIIAAPQLPLSSGRAGGSLVVDVFGDSIGRSLTDYLPPLPGIQIIDHTVLGCGIVTGGPYRYFGEQYADNPTCDAGPGTWAAQVHQDRPDEVLLIVGRWETMDRQFDGTWTHVGEQPFDDYLQSALSAAISSLGSSGARVLVSNEPYNQRGEQPNGELYPEDDPPRVDAWNHLVDQAVAARAGTTLLDLHDKLCPDGRFTWTVDGIAVRSDGVHLTPEAVAWLTPWLSDALVKAAPAGR